MWWHILAQPIHQVKLFIEILAVLDREICRCYCRSPFISSSICLCFLIDDIKEAGDRKRVTAQYRDLVAFVHRKRNIFEQYTAINRFLKFFYIQDLVAHFTQGLKNDTWI